MRRVVRTQWGPRPETYEQQAAHWSATLERVASLLPHLRPPGSGDPWTWNRVFEGGAGPFTPTSQALITALREEWERNGGLFLVVEGPAGWKLDLRGVAGEASEYATNSMLVTVRSPDDARVPEAELLAAVAELWNPDLGSVIDDDVFDLLEDRAEYEIGDPVTGWLTYLSPARAALVPDDLKAVRTPLSTGGVLLDIAPPDDQEAVLAAHLRLRESGALQPLPRPMTRSML
ncbi:hypothetical protein ACFYVL_15825 [Streptomyces sp. NPDC004111]|uniref:hypothetical protein n=1 Tax=Streptomyces sp. NPDC004111 TaxID=3364690 RepID=UPI0036C05CB8